jgi:hypothetical protein
VKPATHYDARIVSVDHSGQLAASAAVGFETPAAPDTGSQIGAEGQGSVGFTWTMVALAVSAGAAGFG